MPPDAFKGQVILVTGGSRGIGRATAAAFGRAGAQVAITYRTQKPDADAAGQANYSAAKAGLIGFTRALAKEVGSRNITVNAVAPGFITTDLTRELPAELLERARQAAAIQRLGTPDDVAPAIVFLASKEAAYITGQVLGIDGGLPI